MEPSFYPPLEDAISNNNQLSSLNIPLGFVFDSVNTMLNKVHWKNLRCPGMLLEVREIAVWEGCPRSNIRDKGGHHKEDSSLRP